MKKFFQNSTGTSRSGWLFQYYVSEYGWNNPFLPGIVVFNWGKKPKKAAEKYSSKTSKQNRFFSAFTKMAKNSWLLIFSIKTWTSCLYIPCHIIILILKLTLCFGKSCRGILPCSTLHWNCSYGVSWNYLPHQKHAGFLQGIIKGKSFRTDPGWPQRRRTFRSFRKHESYGRYHWEPDETTEKPGKEKKRIGATDASISVKSSFSFQHF